MPCMLTSGTRWPSHSAPRRRSAHGNTSPCTLVWRSSQSKTVLRTKASRSVGVTAGASSCKDAGSARRGAEQISRSWSDLWNESQHCVLLTNIISHLRARWVAMSQGSHEDLSVTGPTLIPALGSCKRRMTSGERRLAERLQVKLEADYLVWYDIPLGRRRLHPDFVILHPLRGVLILEVKDWK